MQALIDQVGFDVSTIGVSRLQPVLVSIWLTAATRVPLRAAFSRLLYAKANAGDVHEPQQDEHEHGEDERELRQRLAARCLAVALLGSSRVLVRRRRR